PANEQTATPASMTTRETSVSPSLSAEIDEGSSHRGTSAPADPATPRIMAKPSANPTASTPSPNGTAPKPHPRPNSITVMSEPALLWRYTSNACGIVVRISSHGQIR